MGFLAVADVRRPGEWHLARVRTGKDTLRSRDVIDYINKNFCEKISRGAYDDIRRKDLKLPVLAGIILASANRPDAARNDPTRGFSISNEFIEYIQNFGSAGWECAIADFIRSRPTLAECLDERRKIASNPVVLPNGKRLEFSPGSHNQLQRAVIEQFLPRFGYDSEVLYVGDSAKRFLVLEVERLAELKFFKLDRGELPDVVAYSKAKNWLYLIEAVHSSGPISPIRLLELRRLTHNCTAGIVFVTAFLDRATFRKFAPDIAWETEVWIAESPDHLVHFNGDKFIGPHKA